MERTLASIETLSLFYYGQMLVLTQAQKPFPLSNSALFSILLDDDRKVLYFEECIPKKRQEAIS